MVIEKLSDGDPSVLAIGTYGGDQVGFDSVLGTKLIDQLKKLVGGYHVNPLETNGPCRMMGSKPIVVQW